MRKLEGCLLTRGVENTKMTDCISSLHINSIKLQKRRHLGFGFFLVIWPMILVNIFYDRVLGDLCRLTELNKDTECHHWMLVIALLVFR